MNISDRPMQSFVRGTLRLVVTVLGHQTLVVPLGGIRHEDAHALVELWNVSFSPDLLKFAP